ncbi:unnamed protein product [Parascedosporium putredinis]|uniref:Uncharacterized protein n=1 Tax=Parascedosporium putredinis TaxID=1442378 RepID=A0A9P1H4J3_9PEZI|nr:unnamed protein product [Parascedosporium putredinis]CAI7995725.1 unnamed protein product [Parascedosporium putredinis]
MSTTVKMFMLVQGWGKWARRLIGRALRLTAKRMKLGLQRDEAGVPAGIVTYARRIGGLFTRLRLHLAVSISPNILTFCEDKVAPLSECLLTCLFKEDAKGEKSRLIHARLVYVSPTDVVRFTSAMIPESVVEATRVRVNGLEEIARWQDPLSPPGKSRSCAM